METLEHGLRVPGTHIAVTGVRLWPAPFRLRIFLPPLRTAPGRTGISSLEKRSRVLMQVALPGSPMVLEPPAGLWAGREHTGEKRPTEVKLLSFPSSSWDYELGGPDLWTLITLYWLLDLLFLNPFIFPTYSDTSFLFFFSPQWENLRDFKGILLHLFWLWCVQCVWEYLLAVWSPFS